MRAWAKILLRFEGLNDAASTNFVFDLGELMNLATGKGLKSVRDIMTKTEKLLMQLSQNFGDVPTFVSFLIACVGAEVIHKKAQLNSPEGRAYNEANKWLIGLRHDNVIMTDACLEKAISIAEENMTNVELPTKAMVSEIQDDEAER